MFIFEYQKLLFCISKITIFDIWNKCLFSDIRNSYFGYQKFCQKGVLFEISKKVILDIKNNNFGYPKINIYFGYQNCYFGYSKQLFLISGILCYISEINVPVFQISQILFRISIIIFLDIWKKRINVNSACHTARLVGRQTPWYGEPVFGLSWIWDKFPQTWK